MKKKEKRLSIRKVSINRLDNLSKINGGSSAFHEPTEKSPYYVSANFPLVLC